MQAPVHEAQFDVLLPSRSEASTRPKAQTADDVLASDPILIALARLMDSAFFIPGTNIRIGLDPIIGLVPIVGDILGGAVSAFIVGRCWKLPLPRVVVARMAVNAAINTVIGFIPLVGDAFSLWFRANERNINLARAYLEQPRKSTRGEWLWMAAVGLALLAAVGLIAWAIIALFAALFSAFSGAISSEIPGQIQTWLAALWGSLIGG